MSAKFSLHDAAFSLQFPRLFGLVNAINLRLRSYCLTGSASFLGNDDGGSPRIGSVIFDETPAAAQEKRYENARLGARPPKNVPIPLMLEIDYGNGFSEIRPFVLYRDNENAFFQAIREKSLYLFRSLYGYRRGNGNRE